MIKVKLVFQSSEANVGLCELNTEFSHFNEIYSKGKRINIGRITGYIGSIYGCEMKRLGGAFQGGHSGHHGRLLAMKGEVKSWNMVGSKENIE